MADRPINLKDWQVRAAVEGRLSVIVVPLPKVPRFSAEYERQWHCNAIPHSGGKPGEWGWWEGPWHGQSLYHTQVLPLTVGDRYWCRETWARDSLVSTGARYYATDAVSDLRRKRPSTQMPRWASRLTLIPREIRVCRVQDVTEDGARAAGVERDPETGAWWGATGKGVGGATRRYVPAALALADLLAKDGRDHGNALFDVNPWVTVATVNVHHRNIDQEK